ncbi:MAG: AAA family ATPase [Spirochaetes bacterium]|nr:AAA family ATPase [Spirochaetota bacterium]
MKIAITGKGGVGKTTIAAAISLILAEKGYRVFAIDADPDSNLASALGIPCSAHNKIVPISCEKQLIEQRTNSPQGGMFKLNPDVSDIVDKFAFCHRGVNLLMLGAVQKGGGGCACPENAFLRSLVQELVLRRNECVILDMEAGIEHLGRATARGVDAFIAVAEPGVRSIETVRRISHMAVQIGISKTYVVLNGIRNDDDRKFFQSYLSEFEVLAEVPYHESIRANDRDGRSVIDDLPKDIRSCFDDLAVKLLTKFS